MMLVLGVRTMISYTVHHGLFAALIKRLKFCNKLPPEIDCDCVTKSRDGLQLFISITSML